MGLIDYESLGILAHVTLVGSVLTKDVPDTDFGVVVTC